MTTRPGQRRAGARHIGTRSSRKRLILDSATPAPVLVATDGSRVSSSAVKWATLMAKRGAWAPEAMTVLEPVPVSVGDMALGSPAPEIHHAFTDSVLSRIRSQLKRHHASSWPMTLQFGRAAPTIARLARERESAMIVLGMGRHGRLARLVGAETAIRVARLSDVPVLAVEGGVRHLPHRALVAVDFGESSIRAAKEALALLDPPGRLHLLHVRWALDGRPLYDESTEQTYALGVEQSFTRLIESLTPREAGKIEITHEMQLGGIIESMLSVADRIHADLVAAGSHSQNVVDRLLIGNTPAQLLRAAKCSVLIVPPNPPVSR